MIMILLIHPNMISRYAPSTETEQWLMITVWTTTSHPSSTVMCILHWLNTRTFPFIHILCPDLDECTDDAHQCNEHAMCNNTVGSYSCYCQSGYKGDGTNCQGKCHTIDGVECSIV